MEQTKQYEYVDLGLPSGLKWAKCNIGAETETDYGDYFMWGSTTPNTDEEYSWASYKYCNGSYDTLTKYCRKKNYGAVDNKLALEAKDDAATQFMGDGWRMPTMDEIYEMSVNTDSKWVTNYNGSGVNGYQFTASNGNSIFIPAAGTCRDGSVYHVGNYGNVWSSSLLTSNPNGAWYLVFNSGDCYIYCSRRCIGRSVRGVMD